MHSGADMGISTWNTAWVSQVRHFWRKQRGRTERGDGRWSITQSTKPNDSRFCMQISSISFSNLYSFLNLSPIFGSHGFYSRLPLYEDGSLRRYSFHTKFSKKVQPQCLQKKSSTRKPTPLNVAQAIFLGELSSATLQGGNS